MFSHILGMPKLVSTPMFTEKYVTTSFQTASRPRGWTIRLLCCNNPRVLSFSQGNPLSTSLGGTPSGLIHLGFLQGRKGQPEPHIAIETNREQHIQGLEEVGFEKSKIVVWFRALINWILSIGRAPIYLWVNSLCATNNHMTLLCATEIIEFPDMPLQQKFIPCLPLLSC